MYGYGYLHRPIIKFQVKNFENTILEIILHEKRKA